MSNLSIQPQSPHLISLLYLPKSSHIKIKTPIIARFVLIAHNLSIGEHIENLIAHIIECIHIFILRVSGIVVMEMAFCASDDVEFESALVPVKREVGEGVSGVLVHWHFLFWREVMFGLWDSFEVEVVVATV